MKAVLGGAVEEVKVTALGDFVPSRLRWGWGQWVPWERQNVKSDLHYVN